MVKKSKASKASSGTKSAEGGKKKTQKKGSGKGSSSSRRKEARQELKEAKKRPQKRAHGKEVDETRQRLRSKWLERQLARGPGSRLGPERRKLLLEMAQLQLADGRSKAALQSLREALDMDPADGDFAVRGPLLCLYLEKAMTEEAASLLKGPLFEDAMQGDLPGSLPSAKQREAITAGCYSIALLSYISVRVLREYKKPKALEEAEERLLKRLQRAHQQNPFIAEFLAFAPAFESAFPFGCELPEASGAEKLEEQLLEALRYCCQWGGRGQAPVWLDTNATVRRFIRETLFEAEDASDAAPLAPLDAAPGAPGAAPVLQRWRRARQEAMQLWATEMAQEAGLGIEEQMEEEALTEDEEIRDLGH